MVWDSEAMIGVPFSAKRYDRRLLRTVRLLAVQRAPTLGDPWVRLPPSALISQEIQRKKFHEVPIIMSKGPIASLTARMWIYAITAVLMFIGLATKEYDAGHTLCLGLGEVMIFVCLFVSFRVP
jgi:hypothetical protein